MPALTTNVRPARVRPANSRLDRSGRPAAAAARRSGTSARRRPPAGPSVGPVASVRPSSVPRPVLVPVERPHRRPAAPARSRPAPLRLTLRGRRLLLGLAGVAITVLGLLAAATVAAPPSPSTAGTGPGASVTGTVVVPAGSSLWTVAQQVAPGLDPRQTVQQIIDLNHLTDGQVLPGQRLLIPTRRTAATRPVLAP